MSIIAKIPRDSRVRYPVNRFAGPLVAGQYDFSTAANTDQLVISLDPGCVYLIERYSFTANIDDGVWLKSMPAVAQFPRFRLSFRNSLSDSIYPEPVRCVNYLDNAEQLVYFNPLRKEDDLLITFAGQVLQVPETVGEAELIAQVNMAIYQVTNAEWITQWVKGLIRLD